MIETRNYSSVMTFHILIRTYIPKFESRPPQIYIFLISKSHFSHLQLVWNQFEFNFIFNFNSINNLL